MPNFVGHDATKNRRDLELGTLTSREIHRMFVVDTREGWKDRKPERILLNTIPTVVREHAQYDFGGFERLLTEVRKDTCGLAQRTV